MLPVSRPHVMIYFSDILNSDHTGVDRTPWSGKPKLRHHTRDQLARAMSYNKQKFKNKAMQSYASKHGMKCFLTNSANSIHLY